MNPRTTGTAVMSKLGTRLGKSALCALVAASATFASTASFAVPAYDGTWSVLVMTEKGTCDPAYRYPIRISNGQLINAGDTAFTVTGKIAQTGAITVTISAGGKSAIGLGKLAGDLGGGSWTGGACSGSWTAERRGA
jgi:hypothetical protein